MTQAERNVAHMGKIEYSARAGTYEDEIKISTDLKYDKKRKLFYANFGGVRYEGETAAQVEGEVLAAMETSQRMTWQDVIIVSLVRTQRDIPTVGLNLKRYHIALQGTERQPRWLKREWGVGDHNGDPFWGVSNLELPWGIRRNSDSLRAFTIPFTYDPRNVKWGQQWTSNDDNPTYYLEYTEYLWKGLTMLQNEIAKLHAQLLELLGSDLNLLRIEQVGAGIARMAMLQAPAETIVD